MMSPKTPKEAESSLGEHITSYRDADNSSTTTEKSETSSDVGGTEKEKVSGNSSKEVSPLRLETNRIHESKVRGQQDNLNLSAIPSASAGEKDNFIQKIEALQKMMEDKIAKDGEAFKRLNEEVKKYIEHDKHETLLLLSEKVMKIVDERIQRLKELSLEFQKSGNYQVFHDAKQCRDELENIKSELASMLDTYKTKQEESK